MGKKITYCLIIFYNLLVMPACSPTSQYKILTFFFDGVPDTIKYRQDTLLATSNNAKADTQLNRLIKNKFFHEPYKERDCMMCHDERQKNKLNQEQPGLCYNCHEDFADKYKYVHGPVAGGFCTECHTAHMSDYDKLLLKTGQELCLACHESNDVFANENHEGIDSTACTECHNPHGGDDRYLF